MASGLLWPLLATDKASPAFLRVAGAADKAATATARATKSIGGATDKMAVAGKKLTKGLTLPLAAAAAVSVDQAAKWQKSMTLIQTAGGETAAKTTAISKGLMKVATDTGTSLDQLGQGIYTVAKAGGQKWSAAEQLNVMKVAAEGAKAENVPLATSVSALTSVMMSYHVPASKAVAVQNELIRGAGLAKTTMQEYASSLATVIPVASAAGVGFDQVAGAVATLTQHGTSAQEATQELAFTIRNLQAPNNVAISAMNQLGISSVNVSKNLGKRGLTGTLSYIESKLPKSGLVYLDTMKKMESGTQDLTAMQAKMSPQLKTLSTGFLKGSVSLKDYRAGYRALGADGASQGQAFQNLALKVRGFNDNVKAGTPAQKTMAAELKAIFGGATGLNTALQLGGENAKYFADATKSVGKAALTAGSDVLGWNKTQGTLAVKMDRAKESLQVMAVEIGTALIPAVGKIADAFSKAAHWVDGLSGTQKKVLAWSIGVLAAIGPVMAIGARLALVGRGMSVAINGMMAQFSRLSFGAYSASGTIGTAMKGVGAALGGAGIGLAVGELTKNSSTAVQAIGVLGSAAAGAAFGSGFGPLGTVIGGVAGGVTALATDFFSSGDAAKKSSAAAQAAMVAEKAAVDDVLSSLQSLGDQYGANFKLSAINKLQSSGIYEQGKKLGINPQDITGAVLGTDQGASSKIINEFNKGKIGSTQGYTSKEYQQFNKLLQQETKIYGSAQDAYQLYQQAQGKGILTTKQLAKGTANLSKEITKGAGLNVQTSSVMNDTTGAAKKNTEVIHENITALNQSAATEFGHTKSLKQTAVAYASQIVTLRKTAVAMGLNGSQVDAMIQEYGRVPKKVATAILKSGLLPADIQAYIAKYNLMPKTVSTTISAKDNASTQIAKIHNALAALANRSISIDTYVQQTILPTLDKRGNGAKGEHGGPGKGSAAGSRSWAPNGKLPPGYSTVGERGWELVKTDRAGRSEVFSHKQSKAMTGLPDRLPGFAGGTGGGLPSGITHRGKDYLYAGTRYASLRAAENARTAASKKKAKGSADAVTTALGAVGQTSTPRIDLSQISIGAVNRQVTHAANVLHQQIASGLSKKTAAGLKSQLASLSKQVAAALSGLRLKIRGSDIAALRSAVKGTVDDTRTAYSQLITDMAHAGASAAALSLTRSTESRMLTAQNRLIGARQLYSDTTSNLRGAFDPTQYGSAKDLIAGLGSATGSNNAYSSEERKLKALGLNSGFLNQLLASGQTATLQSLSGSSKAQIAQVNKAVGSYNTSVAGGGNAAVDAAYGASVTTLTGRLDDLVTVMAEFAAYSAKSAQRPIELNGKQIADMTDKQLEAFAKRLNTIKSKGRKAHH